jgi:flagellar FliJ protein
MAGFRFRLATLMKLREATRDDRRRSLAKALEALQILQGRIAGVQAEQRQLIEECRSRAHAGAVDVDELLHLHRYQWQLKQDELVLHEQMRKVSDEVEKRRLALVEADRQVKTLEKLRERQLERYRFEQDRREAIRLDEIATVRAARPEVSR